MSVLPCLQIVPKTNYSKLIIKKISNQFSGFVFADAGFDVWIGNSRGTPASQKHIGYGPEDDRFWNFTYDFMLVTKTKEFKNF